MLVGVERVGSVSHNPATTSYALLYQPLAKRLGHRAILRTSSLAHKGQDCDHEHDVMEIPADLVDKMISELEPQDSGA
jgi:hypothetical protein